VGRLVLGGRDGFPEVSSKILTPGLRSSRVGRKNLIRGALLSRMEWNTPAAMLIAGGIGDSMDGVGDCRAPHVEGAAGAENLCFSYVRCQRGPMAFPHPHCRNDLTKRGVSLWGTTLPLDVRSGMSAQRSVTVTVLTTCYGRVVPILLQKS
jgi:hypothetical protein